MTNRPISTSFNVYWMAVFEDEYCGCGECSRGLVGVGTTEQAAIDNLLERADVSGTHD